MLVERSLLSEREGAGARSHSPFVRGADRENIPRRLVKFLIKVLAVNVRCDAAGK